mmetsp:Transcript_43071/g.56986  ORF Transcript_43071/g.56986 Transcript_43071/m.56986 type:complete len:84 (+) Transcript_43071:414-665(+)
MLNSLYGETDSDDRSVARSDLNYSAYYAKKTFEGLVKGRKDLDGNFCSYIFYSVLFNLCCCFKSCLMRHSTCIRSRWKKYAKI